MYQIGFCDVTKEFDVVARCQPKREELVDSVWVELDAVVDADADFAVLD